MGRIIYTKEVNVLSVKNVFVIKKIHLIYYTKRKELITLYNTLNG